MNVQDSQSELEFWEGMFGKSTNAKGNAEGYITYPDFIERLEAYVTTRVKEAEELLRAEVNFYKDRCKMERNKYDILAKSTQEKVKEAERLARINELERFTSEPRRSADSFHRDVYVIKTARLDQRIEALTTTTNGKEE